MLNGVCWQLMEAEGGHFGLNGDNKGLFVGKWRQYGSYWRLHKG